MANLRIEKICPPASELSGIIKNVQCQEEGCFQIFRTSSHLQMHIVKHHRNQPLNKDKNTVWQYHCPKQDCPYSLKSEKYFKTKKLLKQHYLKVHAEKKFICTKCQKGFPTEAAQKHHSFSCGIKFYCSCSTSYDSYQALYSHTKRHQHTMDPKYKEIRNLSSSDSSNEIKCVEIPQTPQIIPVSVLALLTICDLPNKQPSSNLLDKEVQTEPRLINNNNNNNNYNNNNRKSKKNSSPGKNPDKSTKRKTSQTQTQTRILSRNKRPKTSTQTQTGDSILKKSYKTKRKKSMETQTMLTEKSSKYVNTLNYIPSSDISLMNSINEDVYEFDEGLSQNIWLRPQKNTSATQTSPISSTLSQNESVSQNNLNLSFLESDTCSDSIQNYFNLLDENLRNSDAQNNFPDPQVDSLMKDLIPNNRSCTIETQTEIDPSCTLFSELDDLDMSAGSSNETQTTNDIELIYSNMYTQTCEDILFSDFDFADIETQTAWPHYENESSNLVSTETQTAFFDKSLQPSNF